MAKEQSEATTDLRIEQAVIKSSDVSNKKATPEVVDQAEANTALANILKSIKKIRVIGVKGHYGKAFFNDEHIAENVSKEDFLDIQSKFGPEVLEILETE